MRRAARPGAEQTLQTALRTVCRARLGVKTYRAASSSRVSGASRRQGSGGRRAADADAPGAGQREPEVPGARALFSVVSQFEFMRCRMPMRSLHMMQKLPIHCIVEGWMDEAAVRKLFSDLSLTAGAFYHTSIPAFEARLRRFNEAARHAPWFALCDLDREECAPVRLRRYLPDPGKGTGARTKWKLAKTPLVPRRLQVRARLAMLMVPREEPTMTRHR